MMLMIINDKYITIFFIIELSFYFIVSCGLIFIILENYLSRH